MKKSRVIKYRWVVLSAVVLCGLSALPIALGVPLRKGVTPANYLACLLAMSVVFLAALVPVSIPKIVAHRWLVPISTTWAFSIMVAGYLATMWLIGFGHQCDRVVITLSGVMWCVFNTGWVASRLLRWRRTAQTNRAGQKNDAAIVGAV